MRINLSQDSVLSLSEVHLLLELTDGLLTGLGLSQTTTDGTGLLLTHVQRSPLGLAVVLLVGGSLVLVEHGEDAGDGLADDLTVKEKEKEERQ